MDLRQTSWVDLLHGIETANESSQVVSAIEAVTARLGFQHWSYGARPHRTLDYDEVRVLSNYPPGWMHHYLEEDFLSIDTSVLLAETRLTTINWAEAQSAGGDRLWAEAADCGLRVGLAHPTWDRMSMFGLLSVARESKPITPAEFEFVAPRLAWISGLAHAKLRNLESPCFDEMISLSDRELQILRWTALGKTASEVASITGVATRTVNFHIGNILVKLNATNKIQATVRATVMGLL